MSKVLEKALEKDFFRDLDDTGVKRLSKKLKESAKEVRNGRMRKFFTSSSEYINSSEEAYDFIKLQNEYFYEQWAIEKEQAWAFLNDESEVEKAGWNSRKPQPEKLLEWAEKAYPKAKTDIWDVEFEQYLFDRRA